MVARQSDATDTDTFGAFATIATRQFFGFIPGGYGIAVNNLVDPTHCIAGAATVSVPEPGTWAMMGLGQLGLGIVGASRPRQLGDSAAV